ncbi:hypothetical protein [Jiangella mangrovi]|uniref:Uncharacterized protein n=1 Tax=Jiangella mangrovi TaxID=1524084 RepID=A0A7W9GTY2_9ACTN|nr:hypothetical protein [Jiangella mangrovi]
MTDSPPPFVARAASWPLEFVLVTGYVALFAGCGLAALAVPAEHGEVRIGLVVVVVGVYALWAARLVAALCVGVVAWCAATAFLLGHGGELALTGRADALRLGAFLLAAAAGSAVARAARICVIIQDRRGHHPADPG